MAETFSRPRFTQGGPSATKTFVPGGPVNIYDGKRMRKAIQRKTVDHYTTMFRYLEHRKLQTHVHDLPLLEPDSQFTVNVRLFRLTSCSVDSSARTIALSNDIRDDQIYSFFYE